MRERLTRRGFLIRGALGLGGLVYATNAGENPPVVEAFKIGTLELFPSGIFPTEQSREIVSDIAKKSDGSTPWKMVLENLYPVGNKVFLFPSRDYRDMFFRDCEYVSPFIDSNELSESILRTFETRQTEEGQIPTAVSIITEAPYQYSDDETTLLYIISVARQKKANPAIFTPERKRRIEKAISFVKKHVADGEYISPAGSRRGWVDAFEYPKEDVITQTQGLYAVGLIAAKEVLELDVAQDEIDKASDVYRKSANSSGFLPLSRNFNQAPAIGGLYPEFLAMTMFDQEHRLLTPDIVFHTLAQTPKSNNGFKILTASAQGDYFERSRFIDRSEGGKYQNGGAWPLWNSFALAVGELYGVISNKTYRLTLLKQLKEGNYPESIRTGGRYEDVLSAEHLFYLWNLNIFVQQKILDSKLPKAA